MLLEIDEGVTPDSDMMTLVEGLAMRERGER